MIALDLPPPLWVPPKPAIIRPADDLVLRPGYFSPVTGEERRSIIAELVRSGRIAKEQAKQAMLLVPVLGWSSRGPFSIAYVASSFVTSGFTVSGISIGAAPSAGQTRHIFLIYHRMFGTTADDITAGDITPNTGGTISCTILAQTNSGVVDLAFLVAAVPSGTTADITITNTGGFVGIGVYRAINWSGNTTLVDSQIDTTPSSGLLDLSVDTVADGFVLAGSTVNNGSTSTWVGATENYDTDMQTGEMMSGALASGVVAATPRTVTVDNADTTTTESVGMAISLNS